MGNLLGDFFEDLTNPSLWAVRRLWVRYSCLSCEDSWLWRDGIGRGLFFSLQYQFESCMIHWIHMGIGWTKIYSIVSHEKTLETYCIHRGLRFEPYYGLVFGLKHMDIIPQKMSAFDKFFDELFGRGWGAILLLQLQQGNLGPSHLGVHHFVWVHHKLPSQHRQNKKHNHQLSIKEQCYIYHCGDPLSIWRNALPQWLSHMPHRWSSTASTWSTWRGINQYLERKWFIIVGNIWWF